jgi:hypothetical protein
LPTAIVAPLGATRLLGVGWVPAAQHHIAGQARPSDDAAGTAEE